MRNEKELLEQRDRAIEIALNKPVVKHRLNFKDCQAFFARKQLITIPNARAYLSEAADWVRRAPEEICIEENPLIDVNDSDCFVQLWIWVDATVVRSAEESAL